MIQHLQVKDFLVPFPPLYYLFGLLSLKKWRYFDFLSFNSSLANNIDTVLKKVSFPPL